MVKGTPARGKHNRAASHNHCRRCGTRAYHRSKKVCASCGYGRTAKLRTYNWKKDNK